MAAAQTKPSSPIALVIHGGAGTILKKNVTPEQDAAYRKILEQAIRTGYGVLQKGGSSLDAVEATIRLMEDSPMFNAGKGAVFTHEGRNELDASIMNGKTLAAGAVAGVSIVKNPISAARAVMEKSKHVMMAGKGAELFATEQGLDIVDPSYFWTERRWKELQEELMAENAAKNKTSRVEPEHVDHFGTVGCVALDKDGNLAAGTSTGGLTNKRYGRIGDSPVIGAGTYANNRSAGVSATGTGEYFIRWTVAHDIAALVEYRGMTVQQAADEVIHKKLPFPEGDGGVIVMDAKGNHAFSFNTEGMYRGYMGPDGIPHIAIYKDEK
ncbi:MAG: isoaspartyl peptidase/L-asparaginase [Acidobacteriota bacterium]